LVAEAQVVLALVLLRLLELLIPVAVAEVAEISLALAALVVQEL